MSTGVLPQNRPLQSLSNIDLAHRNKKVITTPTRPPASAQPKPKDAYVMSLFSRPLFGEIEKPVAKPPHVRRIYEKDFLLKFKYAHAEFPTGVITPNEIIAQYNKEFELRERQAASEPSTLLTKKIPKAASVEAEKQDSSEKIAATKPKTVKEPREKKIKLRIPSSPNVSRMAMFTKATPSQAAAQPAPAILDDKENKLSTVPSQTQQAKPKPTTAAPLAVEAPVQAPVVPITPAVVIVPVPIVPAVPKLEPATPVIDGVAPVAGSAEDLSKKMKSLLKEEDPRRLSQRQKQIDYGKNTAGYVNYMAAVPKSKRKREDPKTPNRNQVCSKRSWDGQIRKWRRMLHFYDPNGTDLLDGDEDEDMDTPNTLIEAIPLGEKIAV